MLFDVHRNRAESSLLVDNIQLLELFFDLGLEVLLVQFGQHFTFVTFHELGNFGIASMTLIVNRSQALLVFGVCLTLQLALFTALNLDHGEFVLVLNELASLSLVPSQEVASFLLQDALDILQLLLILLAGSSAQLRSTVFNETVEDFFDALNLAMTHQATTDVLCLSPRTLLDGLNLLWCLHTRKILDFALIHSAFVLHLS